MIKNLILALIISISYLNAYSIIDKKATADEEKATKNRNLPIEEKNVLVSKSYKEKTNDEENSNWNAKDWENHLSSGDENSLYNSKTLFEQNDLNTKAFGGNPNEANSANLKDEETVLIWDTELQDGLIANTTGNGANNNVSMNSTVKCYISRDVPIRYRCGYNGLTVAKSINSTGIEAKNQCEENCIEEQPCIGLVSNPSVNIVNLNDLQLKSEGILEKEISTEISSDVNLKKIEFELKIYKKDGSTIQDEEVFANISISTYDFKEEIPLIKNKKYIKTNETITFMVNEPTDKILMQIERANEDVYIEILQPKAIYKTNAKFICKNQQDISNILPNKFANKCPSGNIVTFNIASDEIKICADYGIIGDNRDGTFSELDTCNSACKRQHSCKLSVTINDTALLQEFREGCIEGQEDCTANVDVCEDLRKSGAKVLNENVFNARQEITNTIINSVQVQNVNRPRVLLRDDIDFQTRKAEEWKDEGYAHMLKNNNFRITAVKLDQDTQVSSAYAFGIDDIGLNGLPVRGLYWQLKPKAYDVDSEELYFYSILEVILERYEINEDNQKIKIKDKVLYLKTDENHDFFKPFARIESYSQNILIDGVYQDSKNHTATWKFKKFNTSRWVAHSNNDTAEFFKKEKLIMDMPFKRINLIKDVKNLINNLKGVVRSIVRIGPYKSKIYSGSFNGTGETVGKYTQYAFYSATSLTYQELFDKIITNEELNPIYDSISASLYSRNLNNDNGELDSFINTYLYGKSDKKSAFVRIFPRPTDVTKKGFLYIFAY